MPHNLPKGLDAQHDGNKPHEPDQRPSDDVNDPQHYKMSAASKAHGTHGRGGTEEELLDEQAVDTGDDPQFRRAGGGGDQPPSPTKMRDNSAGRMGGPGWGNAQAGGSSVDRRPDDSNP
jgi:hypothetical protein